MFTFSFSEFNRLRASPIPLSNLLDILNLQGLEVKKVLSLESGDTAITIEVKANRAFCLSYWGLLREVAAFKKEREPLLLRHLPELSFSDKGFPIPITVEAKSACPAFGALVIRGIQNQGKTPELIAKSLEAAGVSLLSPVVDILNYIMLETGQPLHAYDLAKLQEGLVVRVNKHMRNVETLNGTEVTVPRGTITICDGKDVLALAGVVGTTRAAVTPNTRDILVECASFNPTAIRIAARTLKIHTLSGFRFERGVDPSQIKPILAYCLQELVKVVGGEAHATAFYFGRDEVKPLKIMTSLKKINAVLGLDLTLESIKACLEQYFFGVELTRRGIEVTVPAYRLDIKQEIEVIGELARIYGYHHIEPTLPRLPLANQLNLLRQKSLLLREILLGLGFSETINYSFIPANSMQILGVEAGHRFSQPVMLQNPLSLELAMMRPSLITSLLQTAAYNYSIGNKDLALFELGKTYFSDSHSDTGHRESHCVAGFFTGVHLERGFGLVRDMPFQFFDLSNVLNEMMAEFNQSWSLERKDEPFFVKGAGFSIVSGGVVIGFCGQIAPAVFSALPNGKLIQSDAYYFECDLAGLTIKPLAVAERSVFPGMIREYNFWANSNEPIERICALIQAEDELVHRVKLKDIYAGKGIPEGKQAVLISVSFKDPQRTLTSDEVTKIENRFLMKLSQAEIKLGAVN